MRTSRGKSTLLQVLISIQSMILCEEPFLNEPGWASQANTPQSRACTWWTFSMYVISLNSFICVDSANVRRMVVRTAVSVEILCTQFVVYSWGTFLDA